MLDCRTPWWCEGKAWLQILWPGVVYGILQFPGSDINSFAEWGIFNSTQPFKVYPETLILFKRYAFDSLFPLWRIKWKPVNCSIDKRLRTVPIFLVQSLFFSLGVDLTKSTDISCVRSRTYKISQKLRLWNIIR